MTPEQLKKAIEFAKQNPDDPQSVALRRRMESGKLNFELKQAGLDTFEIPKIDVQATISDVKQQTGRQSELPQENELQKLGSTLTDTLQERQSDQARIRARRDKGEITGRQALFQRVGQSLSGAGEIVVEGVLGLAELGLPQVIEDKIAFVAQGTGKEMISYTKDFVEDMRKSEVITDQEIASQLDEIVDLYQTDETFRDDVRAAGGFLESLGLKPAKAAIGSSIDVTKDVTKNVKSLAPLVEKKLSEGVDILKTTGDNLTPNTTGVSEAIIASVNKINPSKRQEFKAQQGVSEEQWLRERGIIGTREQTIKQLITNFNAIKDNVDEALDRIPGTYRDPSITAVANDSLEFAKSVESPELSRIAELTDKASGIGLSTKEINELKRFYERNIKVGYLKDPTKTAESVQLATNRDSALREYLFKVADQNGFDNLRELNKEIQANKFLADEIAGKMEGQASNNLMSLTDWIVATPGIVADPKFLAGFVGKKIFSTESVRAFAARALAGFPKVKDIPTADLDEITKRAQKLILEQEDIAKETRRAALIADELQKNNILIGANNQFLIENPIPVTRQEQALIRAAEERGSEQEMVKYILEQRDQGNVVGEGFSIKNIDTVPILNPQSRFDPNRLGEDIKF